MEKETMEPEVIVKRKGGLGGKIIALSLGFVLGAGSLVGGVAALGYWALSTPIKDVEKLAQNAVPSLDLSKYLEKEYYEGNVLNLIGGISTAVGEISSGQGGFSSLAKISPTVKEAVRTLAKNMKNLGSNLEEDAIFTSLMNTPFGELGGYLSNTLLKSVEVGPMLLGAGAFNIDVLTQDNLMMTLFYGVEGEDYEIVIETDERGTQSKKIVWVDGGRKPLSIGEIQGDGISSLLTYIPVDSLLSVKEGDSMMAALAYGPSSRYIYTDKLDANGHVIKDVNGEPVRVVQMNARAYTFADGKFYDEDGNELACEATLAENTENTYILTFKDEENNIIDTQYAKLRQSESEPLSLGTEEDIYDIYKDEACTKVLRYQKTTLSDLMNSPENLLGSMEIASVMGLEGQGNLNPLLAVLAYGVEGEDFIWVEKEIGGEVEKDENGDPIQYVQLLPGKKPKTIDTLQGDSLDSLVTDLPLASIINVDPSDAMMTSLAYGAKSHYTIIDGKVEMKQIEYTFDGSKWYDIDGEIVSAVYDSTAGTLTITHEDSEETLFVTYDNQAEKYLVINENGDPVLYAKTTVGDLQNNTSELLDSVELASVMDVTPDSNSIMIALAYGIENEDYIIEERETTDKNGNPVIEKVITSLPGKKPKTIGDLTGEGMDETITNMPLDVLMDINLEDGMMTSLAYGASNKYEIKEKQIGVDQYGEPVYEKYVEMKQVEYTLVNDTWRDIDGNVLFAVYNSTAGTLTIAKDGNEETVFVTYDSEAGKYFVVDESGEAVKYSKTTVGTLQQEPASLIDQIELGEVLNVHPQDENADKLMLALAYGNKGEHYDFDINGDFYFKEIDGKLCKPRTIGDLRNDSSLFKTLYIGDAMDVNAQSHSVLIAIAYGEEGVDFDFVPVYEEDGVTPKTYENGEAVLAIQMKEGKKPRSIEELQGGNSDGLINSITLESALGIDANSDAMMRSLAYGQEGVHYENIVYTEVNGENVAVNEKVTMKHASYTPVFEQDTTNIIAFYNRFDEQVNKAGTIPTAIAGMENAYTIILEDDSVQIVKKDSNGEYKVFAQDGTTAIPYAKTTLGQLSHSSSSILNSMTLADALGIDKNETDGLKRSLAFDKNGNAYTIGQLSENPNMIIDAITLADAIGVDANSDAMMRALAYGQEGVHYQIKTEKDENLNDILVIDMLPAFYTLKEDKMYNRFDVELDDYTILTDGGIYEATVTVDGQVQYLDFVDGKYFVYEADSNGAMQAVEFEATTIEQLSDHSSSLMNSITLADALGVDENETDGLKRALAFAKDGHAYTIGELSDDPQAIVNNIQLDSVMQPETDSPMTMYLLYGKEGVHYEISAPTTTAPENGILIPESVSGDTAQYVIMLHEKMTVHHKQNHETLEYIYEADANGLYVKDGDSYRLATPADTGTRYSAVYCLHNEYGESVYEDENGVISPNHPIIVELPASEQTQVTLGGIDCKVKFTYTFPDDPNTVYRLLEPINAGTLNDIRVKGYYTYNHYEKAYFVQSAPVENGVAGEWIAKVYTPNTIESLTQSDVMTHLTERLTLEEVLGSTVNENAILKPIAHTTIKELPGAVDSLTIAQVFEEDVYKMLMFDGVRAFVNENDNRLYYNEADGEYYTTSNFQAGTKSNRVLTGTWKYLLEDASPYKQDENGTFVFANVGGVYTYRLATAEELANSSITKYVYAPIAPEEYKVTAIGALVGNMTSNIQKATLTQLYEDDIIALNDTSMLEQDIIYSLFGNQVCAPFKDGETTKTKIGQLTITEMLTYVSSLITSLSSPPGM